jgi:hypothetical protein
LVQFLLGNRQLVCSILAGIVHRGQRIKKPHPLQIDFLGTALQSFKTRCCFCAPFFELPQAFFGPNGPVGQANPFIGNRA